MEIIDLFVCIYGLNSRLKCSFSEYLGEKARKFFPVETFFRMSCMKCSSFYSKKPVLSRKIPGCASVTFNITFHPHFHPNIRFFANLPIYRKIIHDNIALCFENQKPFVWYYFEGDIKFFIHINICIRNFG